MKQRYIYRTRIFGPSMALAGIFLLLLCRTSPGSCRRHGKQPLSQPRASRKIRLQNAEVSPPGPYHLELGRPAQDLTPRMMTWPGVRKSPIPRQDIQPAKVPGAGPARLHQRSRRAMRCPVSPLAPAYPAVNGDLYA